MNSPTVLHISPFSSVTQQHGGWQRTRQVRRLLETENCQVVSCPVHEQNLNRFEKLAALLESCSRYHIPPAARLWSQRHRAYTYARARRWFRQQHSRGVRVLVYEHSILLNPVLAHAAAAENMAVFGIPHNMESIAAQKANPFTSAKGLRFLREELQLFRKMKHVFCISREETWLMNCLGIEAAYLPYYPPDDDLQALQTVRSHRSNGTEKSYLVFGTADNPTTHKGVLALDRLLVESPVPEDCRLLLAGYNTEKFRDRLKSPVWQIIGTVPSEDLGNLMQDVAALLVFQKSGSGALTRIPRSLISGIPVLANSMAARNYYDHEGVYVFDTAQGLRELLQQDLPTPPVPARNTLCERNFLDCVRREI